MKCQYTLHGLILIYQVCDKLLSKFMILDFWSNSYALHSLETQTLESLFLTYSSAVFQSCFLVIQVTLEAFTLKTNAYTSCWPKVEHSCLAELTILNMESRRDKQDPWDIGTNCQGASIFFSRQERKQVLGTRSLKTKAKFTSTFLGDEIEQNPRTLKELLIKHFILHSSTGDWACVLGKP